MPQESFFGHMKDGLKIRSKKWEFFRDVQSAVDGWMDYYNDDRYKIELGNLSPNEYYKYITTGEYPPAIPSIEG